jgi:hypothetical protein
MGQREEMVLTYSYSKVIEYVCCVSHSRASAIRIHKQSKLKKKSREREREMHKHSISKIIASILEYLYMTLPTASENSRMPEGIFVCFISIIIYCKIQFLVHLKINISIHFIHRFFLISPPNSNNSNYY